MGHIKGHDKRGANCAVWYVNGDGGVDNTFSSQGESSERAWDTIQFSFDKIADGTVNDGDEIRICKTSDDATHYTISSSLNPAWNNKEITITGANSAGIVDGTQVLITGAVGSSSAILDMGSVECERMVWANLHFDADDDSQHCVKDAGSNHYQTWVNCRFSQATSHGVKKTATDYWNFINCRFDNNGDEGLLNTSTSFGVYYKCLFDNNGGKGADSGFAEKWIECVFYNNAEDGLVFNGSRSLLVNCVFDRNGGDGIHNEGSNTQGVRIGNIFSNNGHAGVNYIGSTDSVAFNDLFYNNRHDTEDTSANADAISEFAHMINYTPGASGYNPSFIDPPNFDFTPGPTFGANDLGMPMPYKWFGTTAGDPGLNNWIKTESVSIF